MTYRIDPLRDTLRLLRGIVRPSTADPFIQQNPRAIAARSRLFRWDSITNDETHLAVASYEPYQSPEPLLMQHLPADAGRRAFAHLMDASPSRVEAISTLLTQHGIDVQANEDCWKAIAEFVVARIQPSAHTERAVHESSPNNANEWLILRGEHFIAPVWHSVALDLALLMGDHAMQQRPELSWCFWADSGFDEPNAYGRSPWLLDTSQRCDQPSRTLLFEMMTTNLANALETRLRGKKEAADVPLDKLFGSLFVGNH